ncbi:MAG: amidohydrolase family protein [Ilumatobacteraceae bacterium]
MTLRIDAHQHLWDLAARPQPWMAGAEMATLRRDFGAADLKAAISDHEIDGAVVVQTVADVTETEELLDLAELEPLIAGVVGYVDVAAHDVGEQLDRLRAGSNGQWLVGVRSLVQYETDPSWLRRPDVLAGFHEIAARGLVHDLLIQPHQIEATVEAVSVVEEGTFVIDHLAKPNIAAHQWEPWASGIAELAHRANVMAKLSGLVTEAPWATWTDDQLRPYVDHALANFGSSRVLFGSDWPVCTLAATYDRVVESMTKLTSMLSPHEQVAVFGGNATSLYSLHQERS